jgi:hypothetical protein
MPGTAQLRIVEPALESALRDMPPEEVRCRSARHRWARDTVLPGDEWPSSVLAWPAGDGRIKIQDPCLDCGLAWRITRTGPGGEMDALARSYIVYSPEWVSIPQGLDRRKRTIRAEGDRRGRRKNQQHLQRALDRAARQGVQPVQPVRFSHGGVS